MAGAVSAGAYTGGVLDYLIQTLDLWNEAKNRGDRSVPGHELSLDIISGASAGGITGAMAALVLHLEHRNPITPDKRHDEAYLKENVFYNAWVNLTGDDMLPVLLDQSDLDTHKVVSLLNSTFIEKIAERTITKVPDCTEAPPHYVSRDLQLILTLSNLDGFTYELTFSSEGASTHVMKQHRDYAFFRIGNDYRGDGRIPLNLQREDVGLTELLQAAPATGAFPVGLAYRKFVRKKKYILDNKDLVYYIKGVSKLRELTEGDPEGDYVTYNVDGGMLNNEPFDLTMKLMAEASGDREQAEKGELETNENRFDSTIIMIDPFPSDDSIVEEGPTQEELASDSPVEKKFRKFPYNLLGVVGKIYASMRGELLFKGEDIVRAFTRTDFSRFMIAPRRREKDATGRETIYNGSVAIACGALGGFAGFFDKNFREHDFYLGRANCQSFLRKYFRVKLGPDGLPANPVFREGYGADAITKYRFQDELEVQNLGNDAPWYVPIIPDMYKDDHAYDEIPLPYPAYDINRLDTHRPALLSRFKRVAKSFSANWAYRLLISLVFVFKSNSIYNGIKDVIARDFRKWKIPSSRQNK